MTTEEASFLFKILGDQTRLRILVLLSVREYCNCELVSIFGISEPAVSRHMGRLKESRLIHERRQGQWVYYSLNRAIWDQLPSFPQVIDDLKGHDPLVQGAETLAGQCSVLRD